ncbi:MAG: cupin domain-containing protein [Pseudomonadota bacterium]
MLIETEVANWPSPMMPQDQAERAVQTALDTGTAPFGLPAAVMRQHGSMTMFFYTPQIEDRQPVHEQDEVYVVVRGSGRFAIGDTRQLLRRFPFTAGDAIFVPAGAVHRFEEFSDDFATWVVMYGPDGGEPPLATRDDYALETGA